MLSTNEMSASVPAALAAKTVQAAISSTSGVASHAGSATASVVDLVAGASQTMTWARAIAATTMLGVLGVSAICTTLVSQASMNESVTSVVQGNSVGTRIAGPARAIEPILLAMQTAAPSADSKAGKPLIDEKTERAIKLGLAWLASQQRDDGSFGMGTYQGGIANTSLAAVALLAVGSEAGHSPYRVRVEKALRYVLRSAEPSGFLQNRKPEATHGPMYHHAFGVLFLSEMYGLSKRPEIRDTLEKAVRLIVETQNHVGGWRYQPVRNDADLSVTIFELNALRAAQAMRLRGGDDWNEWYGTIRDELVRRQNPLGYWPDSIGNDYATAMALIILQMPKSRMLLFRDKHDTR
jgi:hypothetical protein